LKKKVLILLLMILLVLSGVAYSADGTQSSTTSGSGNSGFFVNLGYDGSFLETKYHDRNGQYQGKNTGWMNGGDAEVRFETKQLWSRGRFEYSRSEGLNEYSPTGTKYTGKQQLDYYRGEFVIGYKVLNLGPSTLTPYAGIGYAHEAYKSVNSPDTKNRDTMGYVPVGLNYVYNFSGWSIGVDGAVQLPFSTRAYVYDSPKGIDGSGSINTALGARAELPITVDIYKPKTTDTFKIFGNFTPYYQYWHLGESNRLGSSYWHTYKNTTNIFGFKAGIGFNF
jgi:hypothetical protein